MLVIWFYIICIIGVAVAFIIYVLKTKTEHWKKALIIGLLFLIPGMLADYIGINLLHLWDNTANLLPEFFGIPVGNFPFVVFGGAFFVLIWNEFEKPETKVIFLFAAAGTCAYFVALTIFYGFLVHYPPYDIGWSYWFWLGMLSFMVLCDFLYDKYVTKTIK